jgi:hypothetical protein
VTGVQTCALPIYPTEEENMSLSAEITNIGTAAGEEKVELKINGSVVDTQTVALEIGETALLNFTYMSPEEGNYEANVGTQELEFEVKKKSMLPYVGIGFAVTLIVFGIGHSMIKKSKKTEKRIKKKGL